MMKEYKRDKRVFIPRDEFEEEAGDGLGQLSREEAEADLRELQSRMERRVTRRRAIWLPAAAAVAIILVGTALLVTMLRERSGSGPELAQAEEAMTDTAYIAMASPVEKKDISDEAPVSGGTSAGTSTESAVGRTSVQRYRPVLSEAKEKVTEAGVVGDEVTAAVSEGWEAADDVVFLVVQEVAEEVVVQAVPQMKNAAMKARAEAADRAAVPAAAGKKEAVAVEGTGAGVPDRVTSPVGGWGRYREWVARNISYPDNIRPVLRQEVMVSFTVRPDSTLSDMKALRSPGEAFTREALRLLREGPKWIPSIKEGKVISDDVTLMLVFK